jgi:hypothetical protein
MKVIKEISSPGRGKTMSGMKVTPKCGNVELTRLQNRGIVVKFASKMDDQCLIKMITMSKRDNHLLKYAKEPLRRDWIERHHHPIGVNQETDETHNLAELRFVRRDGHA